MALIDQYIGTIPSLDSDAYGTVGFGNAFTGRQQSSGHSAFGNAFTGYNPSTSGYDNTYTQAVNDYANAAANQGFGGGATGGAVANAGGQWAALDQLNPEISNAAQKYGAPGNLIKSMINNESSGNWDRDGNRVAYLAERGDYILPFVGITKKAADAWGLDWNGMVGNKQAQVDGMAKIMSGLSQQYGGYENAVKVYFMGPAALNGDVKDENGLSSNYYYKKAVDNWKALDQASGGSGVGSGVGSGDAGNNIVQHALQFTGVRYVWGSVPGQGQDPWKTGWDCSGFTKYLSDTYGDGTLPAGSHQQYADTVSKGLLVTDPNQLQAGDLVFFDTGTDYASGMNRASHVGMYIGDGKFVQAANPGAGTIVSNLSDYINQYGFLGGRKMAWSGGGTGGTAGGYTQSQPTQPFSQRVLSYLTA